MPLNKFVDSRQDKFVGNGYLTNISPSLYRQFYESKLPETLLGSEFLEDFGDHWDSATVIEPDIEYPVAQATQHAIQENFRVHAFRAAMSSQEADFPSLLGEIMYQVLSFRIFSRYLMPIIQQNKRETKKRRENMRQGKGRHEDRIRICPTSRLVNSFRTNIIDPQRQSHDNVTRQNKHENAEDHSRFLSRDTHISYFVTILRHLGFNLVDVVASP